MKTLRQIATLIKQNRPALVAAAEVYLKQWQGLKHGAVYFLCDQMYIDFLLQENLGLTDDELMQLGEADINAAGEVDIWIDAAKNLGYTDVASNIETFKNEGP